MVQLTFLGQCVSLLDEILKFDFDSKFKISNIY